MTELLGQYPPPEQSLDSIAANNPALADQMANRLGSLHHTELPHSDVENWQPIPETHKSITHLEPPHELTIIAGVSEELHQQDPAADHDTILHRVEETLFDRTIATLMEAHEPDASNEVKETAGQLVSTAYCMDAINRAHAPEGESTTSLSARIANAGYSSEVAQAAADSQERGLMVRDQANELRPVAEIIPVSIPLESQYKAAVGQEQQEVRIREYKTKKSLYIKDNLRAIETRKFVGDNGVELDLPVLAKFDTKDPDTKIIFTQYGQLDNPSDKPGYVAAVVRSDADNNYQVIKHKDLDFTKDASQQISIEDSQHRPVNTVFIEKGDDRANFTWKLYGQELDMASGNATRVSTYVHADQLVSGRGISGRERDFRHRNRVEGLKEKLSVSKKMLIGLIAVKAMLGSGGAIDQVGEKFNDAQSVVYEAIPAPEQRILLPEDNWADGISYIDAPEGTLEAAQAKSNEQYEAKVESRDTVADLMEQLDGHEYEAIRAQAHEYIDAHPNDILSREMLSKIHADIEAAESNEDVLRALAPFAEFFSVTVSFQTKEDKKFVDAFDPSSDLSLVKDTAGRIVNSLGWLPKEMIEDAALESIEIGKSTAGLFGGVGGVYSENTKSLRIPVRDSTAQELFMQGAAYLQAQDASQEGMIVHEFGHALDSGTYGAESKVPEGRELQIVKVDGKPLYENGKPVYDTSPAVIAHAFWGGILKIPQDVSAYARTSDIECTAENLSAVLSERTDGIAHPDEWRRFNSPANKEVLKVLGVLEVKYPGIAAYIIANNKNLMGNNGLDILPNN